MPKTKTVKRDEAKLFHRYLSAKVLPIWTVLLIDVLIIVVSSLLAYALRYDFGVFFGVVVHRRNDCMYSSRKPDIFRAFRTYSNVLRFSSFVDIMRIFVALTVSYALLLIASIVVKSFTT